MSQAAERSTSGSTIAFVLPRYGLDIVGGAETLLRGHAEHLQQAGYKVQVLTTCSDNINDWNNTYEPGPSTINNVPVLRFPVDTVNVQEYHTMMGRVSLKLPMSYAHEQIFIENSINSTALYDYLRTHADEFKCVILGPYLFGTTYFGAKAVPGKAIILPCFHDEDFARFKIFGEMIAEAQGVIFNTTAEQTLMNEGLNYHNLNQAVVGYGFDPVTADGARFRAAYGLDKHILLYTGRFDTAKNVPLLLDYFQRYQASRQSTAQLVVAGFGGIPIPDHPNIKPVGRLDDQMLQDAYAAATALCQPSVNESFSIVIMESWLQKRPVLVHRDCAVTAEHVQRSQGGLTFGTYEEFAAALDQLFGPPEPVDAMGQRGRAYVEHNYTWPIVTERLLAAINQITRPHTLYEELSQKALRHALNFSRTRYYDHLAHVVDRATQDQRQGNSMTSTAVHALHATVRIGDPSYQPQSRLPVVGRALSWLRRNLTSHLREPYLDPIISRQEQHNQQVVAAMVQVLEDNQAYQARLLRRVQRLEQQVAQLQRAAASSASAAELRAQAEEQPV